jgi:hypothetical protein
MALLDTVIRPSEALALARIYAEDNGMSILLSESAETFKINLKTGLIVIPNKLIRVSSLEVYLAGIRHEALHYRFSQRTKLPKGPEHTLWNCLEDVRIDKKAEKVYAGGRRLNLAIYGHPLFQMKSRTANPDLSSYLFGLKRLGILRHENLGFTYPDWVLDRLEEVRNFPSKKRMREIVAEIWEHAKEKFEEELKNPPPPPIEPPEFDDPPQEGDPGEDQQEGNEGTPGDSDSDDSDSDDSEGDDSDSEDGEGEEDEDEEDEWSDSDEGEEDSDDFEDGEGEEDSDDLEDGEEDTKEPPQSWEDYEEEQLKRLQDMLDRQSLEGDGSDLLQVVEERSYLTDDHRTRLQDLLRRMTQIEGTDEGQKLNPNIVELGLGVLDSDPDLVFKDIYTEDIHPDGLVVLVCDVSGSMTSGYNSEAKPFDKEKFEKKKSRMSYPWRADPRKRARFDPYKCKPSAWISKQEIAVSLLGELAEAQNEKVQIACIAYGSWAEAIKKPSENIDRYELQNRLRALMARKDRHHWGIAGGTNTKLALEEVQKLDRPDNTVYLFISDGTWESSHYELYEKFKSENPKTALIYLRLSCDRPPRMLVDKDIEIDCPSTDLGTYVLDKMQALEDGSEEA